MLISIKKNDIMICIFKCIWWIFERWENEEIDEEREKRKQKTKHSKRDRDEMKRILNNSKNQFSKDENKFILYIVRALRI